MAISIKMEKIKTSRNSKKEEWRARRVKMGEVTTDTLAEKIQANCSMKQSDVNAVLTELTELVQEYLQAGQTVRINGLGRFSLAIESNVVEHPADFSIERDIRAVKCNFVPEGRRDSTKGRNYLNRPWIEDTKVQWAPFCKPEK